MANDNDTTTDVGNDDTSNTGPSIADTSNTVVGDDDLSLGEAGDSGGGTRETIGDTAAASGNSAEKDPSDWVTGDEPMTGAQKSYLGTLAHEAAEELPANLTKAEASENIDRLQQKTGRGADVE